MEKELLTIGDRVAFEIPNVMRGEGFLVSMNQVNPMGDFHVYIAVLGSPGLLTMPEQFCRVIERGALVRRIALQS